MTLWPESYSGVLKKVDSGTGTIVEIAEETYDIDIRKNFGVK